MRQIYAAVLLLLTAFLIYLLDRGPFGVPPLGKMLSPTHGFWKSAPPAGQKLSGHITVETPDGKVDVFYDERGVPHVFAPNESALYYAQGYVQARDRLWQMDFQVRVADGRLSEIIGEDGLELDRFFRRIGIPASARETVEALRTDTLYQKVMESYMHGVNAWIGKLKRADYPLEYKLTGTAPEPWTLEKSVLLLKLMSLRLSGSDTDVQNSNTLALLGQETFDFLFPDFPADQSPIIPSGTPWNFTPVSHGFPTATDSAALSASTWPALPHPIGSHRGIGSNNWAVGKNKTADGGALLCNDPHLGLSFPSIWYEIQLSAPGMNTYGVTIPGSPCVIIGFNEHIAWGVTNGSRDVRDWFAVQYRDAGQREYLYDSAWYEIGFRVETIEVRNGKPFTDTVRWTHVGPVVYDATYGKVDSEKGLAMQWLALGVTNELKTFYYLNKARDHEDYLLALNWFDNPAQNFVFADRQGNVAIKQQGRFKVRDRDRGKFVGVLNDQNDATMFTFIPDEHNPYVLNPPRGFVSSANQHPTDETYPYAYGGWYERYRNRRINRLLDSLSGFTPDDMMRVQNDNYNLMAREMLPTLLARLETQTLSSEALAIVDSLKNWDYHNHHYAAAPSYFQHWFKLIRERLWDELTDSTGNYRQPLDYETFRFLTLMPDHPLIDDKRTTEVETADALIRSGFADMAIAFATTYAGRHAWRFYNASSIEHLLQLDAFGRFDVSVGGSENSVNANMGNHGPSWRMVVRLNGDDVTAWGVYPGGQHGNPGSPAYDNLVESWRKGDYFELRFFRDIAAAAAHIRQL